MSKNKVSLFAVALAICAISLTQTRAGDDQTMDLLMAGPWKASGPNWTRTRIFYENGTFTTQEDAKERGKWSIHDGVVELDFVSGHRDLFILPLIAKGTPGKDSHESPTVAYLQGPAPAGNEGKLPQKPIPAGFSMDDEMKLLTAGPWKVWADGWSTQWTFRKNGMCFSDGGEHGKWAINGNVIEITMDNGHKDTLLLPLDPKAVAGTDFNGMTLVGYLTNYDDIKGTLAGGATPAPAATVVPTPIPLTAATPVRPIPARRPPVAVAKKTPAPLTPELPFPSATPQAPQVQQKLPADNVGVLTAGPWKIQGLGYTMEFSFHSDGTLSWNSKQNGKWHVDGNSVVVEFAGDPVIIALPLNARGTLTSRDGRGGIAMMITANNFQTDAHNSPNLAIGAPPAIIPENDSIAWLTADPWRFEGVDWIGDKRFKTDGTFTSEEKGIGKGTWKIFQGNVELTYEDGRKETLFGPIDPHGTIGMGLDGFAMIGTTSAVKMVANVPPERVFPAAPPSTKPRPVTPPQYPGGVTGGPGFQVVQGVKPPGVAASEPLTIEMQQKAADLVKEYHSSLVFVTGKVGAGSGFVALLGGKSFLVTNAHVAAAIRDAKFKDIENNELKPGAAATAVDRDIYTMALSDAGKPLEVMDKVGENVTIGDEVVVLGNAEGQGVVNLIVGRVTGIGGDRIEVDAPFVQGNSGSPIIHIKSGKVIGIATYLYIKDFDQMAQMLTLRPEIRRFGYRIDNVKQWEAVDPKTFNAQAEEMESIEALTNDLILAFEVLRFGNTTITSENFTNTTVKSYVEQWMNAMNAMKAKRSQVERNKATADFFKSLRDMVQVDVVAARQHIGYNYFKTKLAEQQGYRDELAKAFDLAVKSLSK